MFKSIGPTELIIVAVVVVLLFGGKKIPEFFKGLGDAVKEFKKASRDPEKEKDKEEEKE
ncbi:MAG: twin-arginine translocase TatA/TatE family subunit [Patescibacteria group bacterium]